MKAVTVHLDEPVYADFKRLAYQESRSASELIREAMVLYQEKRSTEKRASLVNGPEPASVGSFLQPVANREDITRDYFDRT
jgi:predicted transcriptional regulator